MISTESIFNLIYSNKLYTGDDGEQRISRRKFYIPSLFTNNRSSVEIEDLFDHSYNLTLRIYQEAKNFIIDKYPESNYRCNFRAFEPIETLTTEERIVLDDLKYFYLPSHHNVTSRKFFINDDYSNGNILRVFIDNDSDLSYKIIDYKYSFRSKDTNNKPMNVISIFIGKEFYNANHYYYEFVLDLINTIFKYELKNIFNTNFTRIKYKENIKELLVFSDFISESDSVFISLYHCYIFATFIKIMNTNNFLDLKNNISKDYVIINFNILSEVAYSEIFNKSKCILDNRYIDSDDEAELSSKIYNYFNS